jgi:3-methylcrotonyl-CoA carboxylase alpha subunit
MMIIEAMKMEHTIVAPAAGRVSEVRFAPGDQVKEGDQTHRLRDREGVMTMAIPSE